MFVRSSNYVTILSPMITVLKLKGNELLIFALIHGFSQDGQSTFKGSLQYLIEWTGLDKTTIIRLLKQLVEKRVIKKIEYEENKIKRCEYVSNYWEILEDSTRLQNATTPRLQNATTPRLQNATTPRLQNATEYNNNNNNNNNNAVSETALIEIDDKEGKNRKTLFRNSDVYELVKTDINGVITDYSGFEKKFAGVNFERIDLIYYFHAVSDWSDQKDVKRTNNGWLATVRNFIRADVERGKVHYKSSSAQNENIDDVMMYLTNSYE